MKFFRSKSGVVGVWIVVLLAVTLSVILAVTATASWVETEVWIDEGSYFDTTNQVWVFVGHMESKVIWVDDESSTIEPIDTASGNNYFTCESEIFVPCPGIPFAVDLNYQSITNRTEGCLGRGWHHSYEWNLEIQEDQALLETEGGQLIFPEDAGGAYLAPGSHNWTLDETATGHEVGIPGGLAYVFGTNGQLTAIRDAWDNQIDCSYGTNNCLEAVSHSNGRQIVFSNEWRTANNDWRVASIAVQDGIRLELDYNQEGQLAQVVEWDGANSHTSSYRYADGFLTNKINGAGFEYSFEYEEENGTLNGKGTYLAVDGYYEHDLTYSEHGNSTDVTYHRRGQNQNFSYSRNEYGVLEATYGPAESIEDVEARGKLYSYSTNGVDKTGETQFDGGATWSQWMQYDDVHNLTNLSASYCTTNPVHQLSLEYDPVWQLPSTIVDADDLHAAIAYTNGLPMAVRMFHSESNSYDTSFSYTTNGLIQVVTNANNHVTSFKHDAAGNMVSVAAELGPIVTNTFNALGFVASTEILSESGASTGRILQYGLNAKGLIEQVVFADGLTNFYGRNALGYITNIIDRAGHTTSYTYAPTEKLTSVTRWLKQGGSMVPVRIGFDRDEQVNVLRISEPRGCYVESYQLDIQDRVTAVTNIEGQVMDIDYYVGDFVSQVVRFDGTSISNTYDQAGRPGAAIYLSTSNIPLSTISRSYHADGLPESVSDGTGTISNRFDRLNRLTRQRSLNPSLEYSAYYNHDPEGNITSSEAFYYRNSWQWVSIYTTSTFDESERIKTRGSHTFAYSPENGRLATVSNIVDGITCSYGFDIMDHVTNITYRTASGTLIRSLDYAYDAASMITNKVVSSSSQSLTNSYQYDSLDRLVYETVSYSATSASVEVEYSYDLAGNRLTKTVDGLGVAYAFGTGNRLASARTIGIVDVQGSSTEPIGADDRWGELWVSNLNAQVGWIPETDGVNFWIENLPLELGTNQIVAAIRDQAGNTDYTTNAVYLSATSTNMQYEYNAAGCMTNLNGVSLDWDERYRLTNATVFTASTTSTVSYAYDVLNRKASRTEGGSAEHYLWEGNQLLADLYDNLWYHRIYAYGPGIDNILTMTIYPSDGDVNDAVTYHYIKDHQNSVIALTDDVGDVVETYEYDAYGCPRVFNASGTELSESAYGNRFCFQGREIDWSTGLYYFRARWYDPETGRWLSKDPIGIRGGLNQYVFCANNPVNFIDPFGLDEDSGWWRKTWNKTKKFFGDKTPFRNGYEKYKEGMEKRAEGLDDILSGDIEGGQEKMQEGGAEAAEGIHDIAMDAATVPGTSTSLGTPGARPSR